jgi:ubiquinone/menaquinone biosynthesis C-methylase UbiE
MEPRLQRRVQRYGWDLAAADYELLWQRQLAVAHARVLAALALAPGERVLDAACGTGLVAFPAAAAVAPEGRVVGIDLSGRMVELAQRRSHERRVANASFAHMDAEKLDLPDAGFDVAVCALGLMYMTDPLLALTELRRVVRPGGRIALAVWGERALCGWAPVFPIVDAEVASDVCPLFFRLGEKDALARLCAAARLDAIAEQRVAATLDYADADEACAAAFVGGPVALAWSRFDAAVRARVRSDYVAAIRPWQHGRGYRLPSEFVIVTATAPIADAAAR